MRTAQKLGVALWLAAATATAGGSEPADPAAGRPGSAPSLFNPWVRFYADFDRGWSADLAEGQAEPVNHLGVAVLESGRLGRALRLGLAGGGAELAYATKGNLDLTRPGALSFWIRPVTWRERAVSGESGYLRFVRVPGTGRSSFIVERDTRRAGIEREKFIVGFFDLSGGENHFLSLRAGPRWRNETWHLIVVAWDATGFEVSVDGAPFTRKAVPSGRIKGAFGAVPVNATWLVGDAIRETTLLDELAVYSRPLDDVEARLLYEAGLGSDAKSAP